MTEHQRLTWAEWKRREDEPRRRMRIDLQAIQRALADALNAAKDLDVDIVPPQSLLGEVDDNPMTYGELLADSLAKVRTRLDEIDAAIQRLR